MFHDLVGWNHIIDHAGRDQILVVLVVLTKRDPKAVPQVESTSWSRWLQNPIVCGAYDPSHRI